MLGPKGEQAKGERMLAALRQVDEGPKELMPGPDEAQEPCYQQCRPHQRQHDLPEDAPLPGAVDPGRIGEFLGQSEKELAQQEDEKGIAEKGWNDERGIGAQQTKVLEEYKSRNEDDDPRDEHGGYGERKEQVTTWEAQARKAIADRGTGHDRAEAHQAGIENTVPKEAEEWKTRIVQRAEYIVPAHRVRPPLQWSREDLAVVLERGDGHPVERQHKGENHRGKQDVTHYGRQRVLPARCVAHASLHATVLVLRAVSVGHRWLPSLPS